MASVFPPPMTRGGQRVRMRRVVGGQPTPFPNMPRDPSVLMVPSALLKSGRNKIDRNRRYLNGWGRIGAAGVTGTGRRRYRRRGRSRRRRRRRRRRYR